MKYVQFQIATPIGYFTRIGVVRGEKILDVNAAYGQYLRVEKKIYNWKQIACAIIPDSLLEFIRNGSIAAHAAQEAVAYVETRKEDAGCFFDTDEAQFLPPLPFPVSLRDNSAYYQHIKSSMGGDLPEVYSRRVPCYRGSTTNSITTGDEIIWCAGSQFMDYEMEIAIVMGSYGCEIAKEDALAHVFGLMIFNDISARDIQLDEKTLTMGPNKGKSFHHSNIFGPYLVTLDEFQDVQDIAMTVRVNGKLMGQGNTKNMAFTMAELIAYASKDDSLYPGEIIGTGTHGGCSGHEVGYKLQSGDTIEIEIDKLGKQINSVGPFIGEKN